MKDNKIQAIQKHSPKKLYMSKVFESCFRAFWDTKRNCWRWLPEVFWKFSSVPFTVALLCSPTLLKTDYIYKDFRFFFLYRIPLGVIYLVSTEKFPKDSWNFEEIIQKEHWRSPLIIKVTQPYQKPTPAQKYFEILLRFSQKFFFRELLYGRNRADK